MHHLVFFIVVKIIIFNISFETIPHCHIEYVVMLFYLKPYLISIFYIHTVEQYSKSFHCFTQGKWNETVLPTRDQRTIIYFRYHLLYFWGCMFYSTIHSIQNDTQLSFLCFGFYLFITVGQHTSFNRLTK